MTLVFASRKPANPDVVSAAAGKEWRRWTPVDGEIPANIILPSDEVLVQDRNLVTNYTNVGVWNIGTIDSTPSGEAQFGSDPNNPRIIILEGSPISGALPEINAVAETYRITVAGNATAANNISEIIDFTIYDSFGIRAMRFPSNYSGSFPIDIFSGGGTLTIERQTQSKTGAFIANRARRALRSQVIVGQTGIDDDKLMSWDTNANPQGGWRSAAASPTPAPANTYSAYATWNNYNSSASPTNSSGTVAGSDYYAGSGASGNYRASLFVDISPLTTGTGYTSISANNAPAGNYRLRFDGSGLAAGVPGFIVGTVNLRQPDNGGRRALVVSPTADTSANQTQRSQDMIDAFGTLTPSAGGTWILERQN